MSEIAELQLGPTQNDYGKQTAIEQLRQKLNEVIRRSISQDLIVGLPDDIPDGVGFVLTNDVRLADARVPLAHAGTHQDGGPDEINLQGMSGLLADAQTPLPHSHAIGEVAGLEAALDAKENNAEKGQPDGYAPLGPDGIVPDIHLPPTPGIPKYKEAVIDFGYPARLEKEVVVVDPDLTALSLVMVTQSANLNGLRPLDEAGMDFFNVRGQPELGLLRVWANSHSGPLAGPYRIAYFIAP